MNLNSRKMHIVHCVFGDVPAFKTRTALGRYKQAHRLCTCVCETATIHEEGRILRLAEFCPISERGKRVQDRILAYGGNYQRRSEPGGTHPILESTTRPSYGPTRMV